MDDRIGDLSSADILIDRGAITAIASGLIGDGATVIDASNMIALPGVIDAHTCIWQTVLRGYIPDLWEDVYFPNFLPLRRKFRPQDNFNAAYIGGFEMLAHGATTVVDYCHNVLGPSYADAALAGLAETGIRRVFTYSFMCAQPDKFDSRDARYADAERIHRSFHDRDSLTTVAFGVDSYGSPDLSRQLEFTRSLGAPSCIHIHAPGAISNMRAQKLIGRDLLAIHGNSIADDELQMMADEGMGLCFTPSADVQGTPADVVRRAINAGVQVVFGCDIPCHVASDPIMQLRIMYNVQGYIDGQLARGAGDGGSRRPKTRPGRALSPRELLKIATIGTAKIFGLEDRIGSLTPGKRADLLLIRRGLFGPSISNDLCAHIMLHTTARDIDTVLVDGAIRMRDGALLDFDAKRAASLMTESRRHLIASAE